MIKMMGVMCLVLSALTGCSKSNAEKKNHTTDTDSVIVPVDPAFAGSIGFFMNGWVPKNFTVPAHTEKEAPASASLTVTVDASAIVTKISPALFGNNSNLYMTQVVTEPVLMKHLKHLHPGIIRYPGGNISSLFFWNAKPADAPAMIKDADGKDINAHYWYGNITDNWTMSVDNYYRMLEQTGSEGIITVNYGYARYGSGPDPVAAAAHLAADWVRYDKGRTRYWEIGNESNGTWQAGYRIDVAANKDGQPEMVTGDLYGRHYKIFADSMRKAAAENGKPIFIGAQLLEHEPASFTTATDKSWNTGVLKQAGNGADYFIVHSYYTPYNTNSNPPEILASAVKVTASMAAYVSGSLTAAGVGAKPVALTEWNIFALGSQQMVSQVAGMHAVMVLGELMKNKFGMASRWDLANAWEGGNDHGLFSQGEAASGETRWTPRPAFYYLYYFQQFLGDRYINTSVSDSNSNVNAYASTFSSGEVSVTLVNKGTASQNLKLAFKNFNAGDHFYWYVLAAESGNTTFSRKVFVNGQGPAGLAGGPADYTAVKAYVASAQQGVMVTLPPLSVVCMVVEKK